MAFVNDITNWMCAIYQKRIFKIGKRYLNTAFITIIINIVQKQLILLDNQSAAYYCILH